jgi:hypothetical protein
MAYDEKLSARALKARATRSGRSEERMVDGRSRPAAGGHA